MIDSHGVKRARRGEGRLTRDTEAKLVWELGKETLQEGALAYARWT